MNEKKIVINQINHISKSFFEIDIMIDKVINHNVKNNKVGEIIKYNEKNYVEIYEKIIEKEKYHVRLNDGSLICFYYIFDDNNSIKEHSMYYIPPITEDILIEYETNSYENLQKNINYMEGLMNVLSTQIRIDYNLEGKKEYIHTNVHMHVGLKSNELRIPIYSKVYPEEFLYFVLKYIKKSDDERIEKLNLSSPKNIQLNESELKRFYINNKLDSI